MSGHRALFALLAGPSLAGVFVLSLLVGCLGSSKRVVVVLVGLVEVLLLVFLGSVFWLLPWRP